MVGFGALVRFSRHRLHDVLPAAPVARTPGIGSCPSSRPEALGGRPAGAASLMASLGAPSVAGGALLEAPRAAKAHSRSAAADAVIARQILQLCPATPSGHPQRAGYPIKK